MNNRVWGSISSAIGLILIFIGFAYPWLSVMEITVETPVVKSQSLTKGEDVSPVVDQIGKNVADSSSPKEQSSITQTIPSETLSPVVQVAAPASVSNQTPCPAALQPSELKGCLYEEWVKEQFDKRIFSIETWNKSGSLDNALTGSIIPDFYYKLETETKQEHFHVECVYRASAFNGEVSWGNDEKVAGLNRYAEKASDPVFLILGLGGKPDMPEKIWIIRITGDTPGKYSLSELPKARVRPDADFKFDPVTKNLF